MPRKKNQTTESTTRPAAYQHQQGSKATLSLEDFTDDNIFAELRRRGYNGELRRTDIKVV